MHLLSEMVRQPGNSQDAHAPACADTCRSEALSLPDVRQEIRPVLRSRGTQQEPSNKSGPGGQGQTNKPSECTLMV